jgi:N-acetylglucosamine-6-sulfatase
VLTVDVAPTLLDVCDAPPLEGIHGRSVRPLVTGESDDWRQGWLYYYNYEKQFPYTPNVRSVRTDRWKYIRYPHGDGSPDRHMAELYDLKNDPGERHNLAEDPAYQDRISQLSALLDQLKADVGLTPDPMPLDEGIGTELPDASIR